MIKLRLAALLILSVSYLAPYMAIAENAATRQFIKGNLHDKTEAVKEARGDEAYTLSREAIGFAIAYREILGEDRDLAALAVAGVLTLKVENVKNISNASKTSLVDDLCRLFILFGNIPSNPMDSGTSVRAGVINRAVLLKDCLPLEPFVALLGRSIDVQSALFNETVAALAVIGGGESFVLLYNIAQTNGGMPYNVNDALAAILQRDASALPLAQDIVQKSYEDARRILNIADKATGDVKGEVSESVLSFAMAQKIVPLQMDAMRILKELRWTRAKDTINAYLTLAISEHNDSIISDTQLCEVIDTAADLCPIASVKNICAILEAEVAKSDAFSESVIATCINALGMIGDKGAFDVLLSVTNAPFLPATLKSAANASLSSLKW